MDQTQLTLQTLYSEKRISPLDFHFAKTLAHIYQESDPLIPVTCAVLSKAMMQGHICLDFRPKRHGANQLDTLFGEPLAFPPISEWVDHLRQSRMVSSDKHSPLVLTDNGFLYLSRYYDLERRLIGVLNSRINNASSSRLDPETIIPLIDPYFPEQNAHTQPQIDAVTHALIQPFTIISGGPGTGKTFVTKIIKQVFSQLNTTDVNEIVCVAPTGKAASKMAQGRTIHSVLKPLKNKPGFYYSKDRPLSADMVIIDEASMIDIALLTRLLEAIPAHAKIVMLGDIHQLSSIQAGSVLLDICQAKSIQSSLFHLHYNFRSKGKSGIEHLSNAINQNHPDLIEQILTKENYPDIAFADVSQVAYQDLVSHHAKPYFRSLMDAKTPESALLKSDRFKILCAHNSGRYGTLSINHLCENILRSIPNSAMKDWHFEGVVMVNTNDYHKGLFNGDTGILIRKTDKNSFDQAKDLDQRSALFDTQDDGVKRLRKADLPSHDPAFAITIHKSQGSEFNTVLILIPDQLSPVLTRQLLYTGVTRAKEKVILAGNMEIIKKAVCLTVNRTSALTLGIDSAAIQ